MGKTRGLSELLKALGAVLVWHVARAAPGAGGCGRAAARASCSVHPRHHRGLREEAPGCEAVGGGRAWVRLPAPALLGAPGQLLTLFDISPHFSFFQLLL